MCPSLQMFECLEDHVKPGAFGLGSAPIAVTDGEYFKGQFWQNASGSLDLEADPQTWFALVAIEFAAFRGALVRLTATEPVAASTDLAIPWDAAVYDTDPFWSAGSPTRLTVPVGVSKVRLEGNLNWIFGGTGYRHIWMHRNGALFFGAAKESDAGDAGVQSIGSGSRRHARRPLRADRPPDLRLHQECRRR